jgi:two-component system chemotaxis response regulator CheY
MGKMLIVDDSRLSRKKLRQILESGDHEVVAEAVDGQDGFEKYKEFQPDVTLLDITMPIMNGFECLDAIKAENKDARCIMVSAIGSPDALTNAIQKGADNYITKPYNSEDVLEVIEETLED